MNDQTHLFKYSIILLYKILYIVSYHLQHLRSISTKCAMTFVENYFSQQRIINQLSSKFPLRNLGSLSYFLGILTTRTKNVIHLIQKHFLANCGMTNLKPSSTPMISQQDLFIEEEQILKATEYRRMIGSLQYLTLTW